MASETSTAQRQRGGRARRQRAAQRTQPIIAGVRRKIPTVELLGEEHLVRIEAAADAILQEVGMDFRGDDEALRLWRYAGADVDGERVRFPADLLRSILGSAPRAFIQHARNPERSLKLGGNDVIFAPAYGSPFVQDLEGGRRYGTLADFENFVKLAYAIPWLHHSGGTVCEPVDVPVSKRHLDMVAAHLRLSDKPFMGSVTAEERAEDSIAMARIVFGRDFVDAELRHHGQHQRQFAARLRRDDDEGAPCLRARQSMRGRRAVHSGRRDGAGDERRRDRPGARRDDGGLRADPARAAWRAGRLRQFPLLDRAALRFADVRHARARAGLAGRRPARAAARAAACAVRVRSPRRRFPDGQAMQESTMSMLAAVQCGANFILHAAGWLEGGLTMGYEKFVMDADFCAALHVWMRGLPVDDNAFALDAFREVGPGQAFLRRGAYARHYETAFWESAVADNNSFEQWRDEGMKDARSTRRAAMQASDRRVRRAEARSGGWTRNSPTSSGAGRRNLPDQWH